jgi:chromosome segregation ATPase
MAAGNRFRVSRNSNPAEPSASLEKEQDNLQDVVGELVAEASSISGAHSLAEKPVVEDPATLPSIPSESGTRPHQDLPQVGSPIVEQIIQGMQTMRAVIGELKSKNASGPGNSKQPHTDNVGTLEADPQQDDQEQQPQTDELVGPSKIPPSTADVKATAAATDMGTGNLLAEPMDEDMSTDDRFLQSIRKHVMDERTKRLHLRQQMAKVAIAEQDLQRRLATSQDNAANLERELRALRLKGKKLREQLDQSRKSASKREIQFRKQLNAQIQRAKEESQRLDDLRQQSQAVLTNLTSQLEAARDVDEDDKKELRQRDSSIAKLQVGIQRVKAAGDAALHSAAAQAHKDSMESQDRIRYLTVQIQQLHAAMKKQSKALAAEATRAKQKASLLQSQMGDLTDHEKTEVTNLKAELSKSHDHEEQTKDELMTRIADMQSSLQKLQEVKGTQDKDLGAKQHEIEQMKAQMKTALADMKAQKLRIRRLFQESRKEEKNQKRIMQTELKTAKSEVNSLEFTLSKVQGHTKGVIANLSGALNASHKHELRLEHENVEFRRELRSNSSKLEAETAEVAALKKRLAQEEDARKKAVAVANKARADFVQAKAVANQLQGTVPQLLEQVQLAHEKRDAEKAMRLQAQAMATNDLVRTNTAAERQMQKQVEQIDKVLPLMSAASQAAPLTVDDDATAGDEIDKALDGTEAATPIATSDGGSGDAGGTNTDGTNTDASKPPASAAAATDGSVVAELPNLDKDGASLAALIQN